MTHTTVAIVNMNLDPAELDGCRALQAALGRLGATALILHHAALRQGQQGLPGGCRGVVLGPQGTPFDAYDTGFLPWLRAWSRQLPLPLLAVCGGMQALALAWGGTLQTVDGGPQATGGAYGDRPRISGPVEVTLGEGGPAWWMALRQPLPRRAALWQRHAEQVATLPPGLLAVASSAATPVEAFVHHDKPWLAVQFHPERGWDEGGEAGKAWLGAWLQTIAV